MARMIHEMEMLMLMDGHGGNMEINTIIVCSEEKTKKNVDNSVADIQYR